MGLYSLKMKSNEHITLTERPIENPTKPQMKNPLSCSICHREFNKGELRRHMIKEHPNEYLKLLKKIRKMRKKTGAKKPSSIAARYERLRALTTNNKPLPGGGKKP